MQEQVPLPGPRRRHDRAALYRQWTPTTIKRILTPAHLHGAVTQHTREMVKITRCIRRGSWTALIGSWSREPTRGL